MLKEKKRASLLLGLGEVYNFVFLFRCSLSYWNSAISTPILPSGMRNLASGSQETYGETQVSSMSHMAPGFFGH